MHFELVQKFRSAIAELRYTLAELKSSLPKLRCASKNKINCASCAALLAAEKIVTLYCAVLLVEYSCPPPLLLSSNRENIFYIKSRDKCVTYSPWPRESEASMSSLTLFNTSLTLTLALTFDVSSSEATNTKFKSLWFDNCSNIINLSIYWAIRKVYLSTDNNGLKFYACSFAPKFAPTGESRLLELCFMCLLVSFTHITSNYCFNFVVLITVKQIYMNSSCTRSTGTHVKVLEL